MSAEFFSEHTEIPNNHLFTSNTYYIVFLVPNHVLCS